MSSLVAQVSAGRCVVDGVDMVNPVLKKNNKQERKMSPSKQMGEKKILNTARFTFHRYEHQHKKILSHQRPIIYSERLKY